MRGGMRMRIRSRTRTRTRMRMKMMMRFFPLGSLPSCSSRLTSLRVIWRPGSYGDHLACIVEGGGDSYRFCGSDGQVLVLRLLEKM